MIKLADHIQQVEREKYTLGLLGVAKFPETARSVLFDVIAGPARPTTFLINHHRGRRADRLADS